MSFSVILLRLHQALQALPAPLPVSNTSKGRPFLIKNRNPFRGPGLSISANSYSVFLVSFLESSSLFFRRCSVYFFEFLRDTIRNGSLLSLSSVSSYVAIVSFILMLLILPNGLRGRFGSGACHALAVFISAPQVVG